MKLLRFSPVVLGLWTFYLLALYTIFAAVFGADLVPFLICVGAVATMALITLAAALVRRRRARREESDAEPRALPDLSFATPTVVVGLALAAAGAEIGPWAAYVGAGIVSIGVGGLVREYRAQRRDLALAARPSARPDPGGGAPG